MLHYHSRKQIGNLDTQVDIHTPCFQLFNNVAHGGAGGYDELHVKYYMKLTTSNKTNSTIPFVKRFSFIWYS